MMHVTGMEQELVQLSSVDVLAKSCATTMHAPLCIICSTAELCADLVVALLTMNASYRAWRFPDEAILLQSRLKLAELHSPLLSSGALC